MSGQIKYITIGDGKSRGICGSGYIDLLSEMLKSRIIDRAGKINKNSALSWSRGFSPVNEPRIKEGQEGLEFVVATAQESDIGKDIVITETDITNLIRSKGAIYTAAMTLMKKMGLMLDDIKKIYIAGGFGNYLNIKKAILVGLLPEISEQKYQFIGNSSVSGARLALLSYEASAKVQEIARKMTYIELSVDPNFMNEYTSSLFLPHTDLSLFPKTCKELNL